MFMFLSVLAATFAALSVGALVVTAGSSQRPESLTFAPDLAKDVDESQFFGTEAETPVLPHLVPVEVVLSQLQQHVRLEQAAAESFLAGPTSASLHSRTESPFVN
jgi:hypothetical protein